MKKFAWIVLSLSVAAAAYAFPTNTIEKTVDQNRLRPDYSDFRMTLHGYQDEQITFIITDNDLVFPVTNEFALFKASKYDESIGSNRVFILKQSSEMTMFDTNKIRFTLAHTNIPPNATYKGELLLTTATTNLTRSLGRGTVKVEDSLYDDGDGTFTYPDTLDLSAYLTKVEAAATYATLVEVAAGQVTNINHEARIGTNEANITIQSAQIGSNQADIVIHAAQIGTNQVDIAALEAVDVIHAAQIGTNQADIAGLFATSIVHTAQIGTNETAIAGLLLSNYWSAISGGIAYTNGDVQVDEDLIFAGTGNHSVKADTDTANLALYGGDGGAETPYIFLAGDAASGAGGMLLAVTKTGASIKLATDVVTPRLTVLGGGNVGIATTNPTSPLHVVGDTYLNGDVGVGTNTPTAQLHVEGAFKVIEGASNSLFVSGGKVGINTNVFLGTASLAIDGGGGSRGNIQMQNGKGLIWRDENGSQDGSIRYDADGIEIGAINADETIELNASSAKIVLLRSSSPNASIHLGSSAGNVCDINFAATAATNMTIEGDNGNVGIGTNIFDASINPKLVVDGTIYTPTKIVVGPDDFTPAARLSVHGLTSGEDPIEDLGNLSLYQLAIHGSDASADGRGIAFAGYGTNNVGAAILGIDVGANGVQDLAFYTKKSGVIGADPVERMRILKSGEVGIGIDAPLAPLHVNGTALLKQDCVLAYFASEPHIPKTTWTNLVFDREQKDTEGNFAAGRFTAGYTANYLVSYQIATSQLDDGKYINGRVVHVIESGAFTNFTGLVANQEMSFGSGGAPAAKVFGIMDLTAGDVLFTQVYHNHGTGLAGTGGSNSWFHVSLIGVN